MTATVLQSVPTEADLLVMDGGECTSNSIKSTTAGSSFEVGPFPRKELKGSTGKEII